MLALVMALFPFPCGRTVLVLYVAAAGTAAGEAGASLGLASGM